MHRLLGGTTKDGSAEGRGMAVMRGGGENGNRDVTATHFFNVEECRALLTREQMAREKPASGCVRMHTSIGR